MASPISSSHTSGPSSAESAAVGLLACRDLFFSTRILDTARAVGKQMVSINNVAEIKQKLTSSNCDLLLIDLATEETLLQAVQEIKQWQSELIVIAFGSHVETELLNRARQAGCDHVWARSRFTKELAQLLTRHARKDQRTKDQA